MEHYQYIILALGALTFLFGGGFFWKLQEERRRRKEEAKDAANALRISGGRLIRDITIKAGKFAEIDAGQQKFRISIVNIETRLAKSRISESKTAGALMTFDSGGGLFFGGEYVEDERTNEFFLPLKGSSDVERYSVYKLYDHSGRIFSFQAYVDHIDTHDMSAQIHIAIGYYL